jgi:hypothetical protein
MDEQRARDERRARARHPASGRADTGWSDPNEDDGLDRGGLSIDCASCAMQHTVACDDCVVTFICSRTADDAVVVDVDEWRAVKLLQDAGLVPKLRHRRRTG